MAADGRVYADEWLDKVAPDDWFRQEWDGFKGIDQDKVDELAERLHEFIAEVIASILDAGSERDAVLENDILRTVLTEELRGWTPG